MSDSPPPYSPYSGAAVTVSAEDPRPEVAVPVEDPRPEVAVPVEDPRPEVTVLVEELRPRAKYVQIALTAVHDI
jgi:hypothetical protein